MNPEQQRLLEKAERRLQAAELNKSHTFLHYQLTKGFSIFSPVIPLKSPIFLVTKNAS
jgi:hypothetical protein